MTPGDPIIWPSVVLDDLRRQGKDPAVSCPRYEEQAAMQWEALKPALAAFPAVGSVLDIGCGYALLDVVLARALRPHSVFLIDGNGDGTKARSFRATMAPWADARMGALMFHTNAPADCWMMVQNKSPFVFPPGLDMVMSSRSWGHHYPISTYLNQVAGAVRPGGLLLIDIRRDTDGLQQLAAAGFEVVTRIPDPSVKCGRFLLCLNPSG
jgi:SAM-dependent methyltransferase